MSLHGIFSLYINVTDNYLTKVYVVSGLNYYNMNLLYGCLPSYIVLIKFALPLVKSIFVFLFLG